MLLPPLKAARVSTNVDDSDQIFRRPTSSVQELARLRRLEDLRSNMHDARHSLVPAIPRPVPFVPLSQSPSAPILHDFSTKTHLARLDLAYERLDAHVDQCNQQLMGMIAEQRQNLENWLQEQLEKLRNSEASSLDPSKLPSNENDMRRILTALEERSETRPDADMLGRILAIEGKVAKPDAEMLARMLAVEAKVAGIPLLEAELRACQDSLAETVAADKAVRDSAATSRLIEFEERLARQTSAHLAEFEDRVARALPRDVEMKPRVATVEERCSALSVSVSNVRTACETSIGDLARSVSDISIAQDMNIKVVETRIEGLQVAIADIAGRLGAEQAVVQRSVREAALIEEDESMHAAAEKIQKVYRGNVGRSVAKKKQAASSEDAISEAAAGLTKSLLDAVADLKSQVEAERAFVRTALTTQAQPGDKDVLSERLVAVEKALSASTPLGRLESLETAQKELACQLEANQNSIRSPLEGQSEELVSVGQRVALLGNQISAVEDKSGRACEKLDVAIADLRRELECSGILRSRVEGMPTQSVEASQVSKRDGRKDARKPTEEGQVRETGNDAGPSAEAVLQQRAQPMEKSECRKTEGLQIENSHGGPQSCEVHVPPPVKENLDHGAKAASTPDQRVEFKINVVDKALGDNGGRADSEIKDQTQGPMTSTIETAETREKHIKPREDARPQDGIALQQKTDGGFRHTGLLKPPEGMQVHSRNMSAPAGNAGHRAHVMTKADRTLQQQMANLQSRMRNAVDVISVHKVDNEEKLSSMEARLLQLTSSMLSRIDAVEKTASKAQSVASSSGGPPEKSVQFQQDLDVGDRTKTRLPPAVNATLQNEEKRLLAKAMVMMEQKLENFVTAEDLSNLREHVDGGLSNIGEQIKSAHDAQIEKTESMLDKILTSRARSTSRSRPHSRSSSQRRKRVGKPYQQKQHAKLLRSVFEMWIKGPDASCIVAGDETGLQAFSRLALPETSRARRETTY